MSAIPGSPSLAADARNRKTASVVAFVVVAMVGMSFAAVPAYRAFCQATGWGGVTQRADAAPSGVIDRAITVRFDAATAADLAWRFKPAAPSQTLKIGEAGLAFYEATNLSDRPVTGVATFNVSPAKAGVYFNKIDCFCFTEQTLQPGETAMMPVTYFIDPALDEDRNLDEVETITLAYTFFESASASASAAAAAE